MNEDYSDIIHLPHHTSKVFPRMTPEGRAAQFAPFAALSGHEAAINEVARYTDDFEERSEAENARLCRQMTYLKSIQSTHPMVQITHFVPDARKKGGSYLSTEGRIKLIDEIRQCVVMLDGTSISTDFIRQIVLDMPKDNEEDDEF